MITYLTDRYGADDTLRVDTSDKGHVGLFINECTNQQAVNDDDTGEIEPTYGDFIELGLDPIQVRAIVGQLTGWLRKYNH